jgi:hypothetical protein
MSTPSEGGKRRAEQSASLAVLSFRLACAHVSLGLPIAGPSRRSGGSAPSGVEAELLHGRAAMRAPFSGAHRLPRAFL